MDFKVEAVTLKQAEGLSYRDVGRRLDALPKLVEDWGKQYQAGMLLPEKAKRRIAPEQQEISELKSHLSRLKMENAILKKAAAYLAKESL